MSKQLITADTIREIKAKGQTQIEMSPAHCIITPEAKEVAEQLGVEIIDKSCPNNVVSKPSTTNPTPVKEKTSDVTSLDKKALTAIKEAIIAKLPKGATISDALIDQLVCRAIKENKHNQAINTVTNNRPSGSGIKVVKGNTTKLDIFEGAGKEKRVGIADVITSDDNSSMAAGYMAWENAFFPWTLNYDEVDVILEGELHIRCQGETTIGKTGDIMFIPKGSSIEFGTPTKVRFAYIAWPANWQEQ